MRRTTITDVAKHAGVGKVTVSYVLNGQSRTARISEETEQRVLKAAADLSYRPNSIARMLVTRKSQALAVVFQFADLFSSGSGFINEVMRGVCAASVEEGYDLMLHTKLVGNPDTEADVLTDGRVDGALILRDEDDPMVSSLQKNGFPAVLFFTRSTSPGCAWVDSDNYAGGQLAARHLLELGHRHIGAITGPLGSVAARLRFQGFEEELRTAGVEVAKDFEFRCGSPREVAPLLAPALRGPHRPTALFAWSDDVGLACLDVTRTLGISVPKELSIIGFDSLDICNRANPSLTSVGQPIFDMAFNATRLLVALTRQEDLPERQIIYPMSLDVRGSTANAPISTHQEVLLT